MSNLNKQTETTTDDLAIKRSALLALFLSVVPSGIIMGIGMETFKHSDGAFTPLGILGTATVWCAVCYFRWSSAKWHI